MDDLRRKIERLIEKLKKRRDEHRRIAKNGSPVTSMAEDFSLGEVAEEQTRIIKQLTVLLKQERK